MQLFASSFKQIWLGNAYFNWPGPEIGYLYSEIGLEVTFETTL